MLAVVILTAAGVFLIKNNQQNKITSQTFLASAFNSIENYEDVFSKLQKPAESALAKAGIISHHFLAKELIADFYNRVGDEKVSTVFLLSPDHFNNYFKPDTTACTSYLNWNTPFGELSSDKDIIDSLVKNNGVEINDPVLGLEHGIYVEIPFIKKFFPNAKIVPLILKNSLNFDIFSSLGEKIKELSKENSILIVSSDFSHDMSVKESQAKDKTSIGILKNLSIDKINGVTNDCKQCLAALCGFLGDNQQYGFYLLDNENSFDISGQNKDSVTSYVSGYYAKKDYVQLLFAGDLMFDRGIRYYAEKGGGNNFIFEKISNLLLSNDLAVVNLEGPITDEKSVSSGTAPGSTNNYFFTFDPSVAKTLFEENIRLVNLGNNHILNFGNKGLASTEKYLDESSVDYFGAPTGQRSIIKNINGLNIAFVSYNEFSSDTEAEQKAVVEEIKTLKPEAALVIVFSHWGVEYAQNPSENIRELAHQFIDAGADLVIGSHSHLMQPMEEYKGKRIYYSLGNFVFDQYFNEDVRQGLGVIVKINKQTKQLEFEEKNFYLQSNGQTIMR